MPKGASRTTSCSALFKNEPFDFEPGVKWGTATRGYYLLGMIIEKASGQTYEQFLQERIFKPLAMSATRYGHSQPLIRHRADGLQILLWPVDERRAGSAWIGRCRWRTLSKVLDLIKWHQGLRKALVFMHSYEAMYRPVKFANGVTRPYGFGWQVG